EPLWYANLGIFAHCKNGNALAHEYSSGYPDYTPEETEKKLEQWQSNAGPTTCEHFHKLNPSVCEPCQHWQKITSPIVLGIRAKTQAKQGAPDELPPSSGNAELDAEIRRLVGVPPAVYERERKAICQRFSLRTFVLDKLVAAARGGFGDEHRQGQALDL